MGGFIPPYLELQTVLDVLLQGFGDGLVEVAEDLHRQLRVYALLADEVIERVRQSEADTAVMLGQRTPPRGERRPGQYLVLRYSS